MKEVFDSVNSVFDFITPISDFFWDFPKNLEWYANIPILGKFSFSILLLIGAGIYFTLKLKFIQVSNFKTGIKLLLKSKTEETGVSSLSAFLLSSAMRVGPGNIMGVTGAITVGGPGALFWMWVSAFLGMATAYVESVLSQIFKEKRGGEFVGGVPFYAKVLLGGKIWIGNVVAVIMIIYFLMNVPSQTFHLFTALASAAEVVSGGTFERTSPLYYGIAILLAVSTPLIIFGGIRRVTKVTDLMVPVMASIYCGMLVIIILINVDRLPYFFKAVFGGAFTPEAIFGGSFGVCLSQGIRRGLMSNEAGQGTITSAAAVSSNQHPCEQGFIQSIGVFLDTFVICSLSGFMVTMAHIWTNDAGVVWDEINGQRLPIYLTSVKHLVPGTFLDGTATFVTSISYALFAFTTLVGMISFAEISVNRLSAKKFNVNLVRFLGSLFLVPFGCLTVLAGLELDNLWAIADLSNIMVVFVNVPIILLGFKIVKKATDDYFATNGAPFKSEKAIGMKTDVWN